MTFRHGKKAKWTVHTQLSQLWCVKLPDKLCGAKIDHGAWVDSMALDAIKNMWITDMDDADSHP